jgi:VWFA-related protein
MKTQLFMANEGGTWLKHKLFNPAFIMGLIIFTFLSTITKGTEFNRFSTKSTTLDSIALIYNQVDAATFPRIVSLVTVTDNAGYIVEKLDENNFEVHEDNVRELPIEVIELTDGGIGINVALVIDRSGSMEGQPIADAKQAASTFVGLMQINDKSAIVSFSNTVRTDHMFSSNKDSLIAAIADIKAEGKTAVFDAVIHAVYLMNDDIQNRAIILLTDGADNSSMHNYQEALIACLSNEIRVFTIGLGLTRNSNEEVLLTDLANETGGVYYYSPTSSDLGEIYRMISKILHHRYQVSYTTHNPAKDGTLRHVRIDVMVNTSTSWDTASYRAPYEPAPVDTLDPVEPKPVEPPIEVVPNPFTPNNDGFNDWTEFKKGDETPLDWNINIMDRAGRLVRNLTNGETIWDGRDKSGSLAFPGFYLYTISKNNRIVHRGIIQLVR